MRALWLLVQLEGSRHDRPSTVAMTTYLVQSRGLLAFVGTTFLAAGGLFIVAPALWALGLFELNGKSRATSLGDVALVIAVLLIGSVAGYRGWKHIWRLPHEIRMGANGTVTFVRVLSKIQVEARDIRAIEKSVRRGEPENGDARELRVRHLRGTIPVSYFDEVDCFVAEMRALNPRIEVADWWPARGV